jgi:hypothetical protein
MTVRFTPQGCKVEKTFTITGDGAVHERITLSVEPGSELSLMVEDRSNRPYTPPRPLGSSTRVRSTRFGFELVPEGS